MNENRITKIEVIKNKCKIEIDGVHHLFLYTSQLRKEPFKSLIVEGRALTTDELGRMDEEAINRGKRRVMYLLAKQDYPKAQLERKLILDGYSQDHISRILSVFVEKGYVDDERLALQKIEYLKRYKSKREIEFVLRNKGFDPAVIKEGIDAEISDESEYDAAMKCIRKKYDHRRSEIEAKDLRNKIYGFLARKGYSSGCCQKVIKNYLSDNADEVFQDGFEDY